VETLRISRYRCWPATWTGWRPLLASTASGNFVPTGTQPLGRMKVRFCHDAAARALDSGTR
jgi:hypothetical protein